MKFIIFLLLCVTTIFANALKDAQSPYLLQHKNNPVNWYEWNKKSLELAKKENKPIFLSIGYSTCHWCHVMNEESFENEHIAKLLNKNYINIKVDKEQLPHIDIFYQDRLNKLKKRRNGWPLNAILTPNLEIIYISTYIPNTFKYGTEGMDTLLPKIANLYNNSPKELAKILKENKAKIKEKISFEKSEKDANNLETKFVKLMEDRYDEIFKGFDKDPKFPLAKHLELLYEIHLLTGNKEAFIMVDETLTAFANSGVYDQVEGGFFRYSVYADLIIPHFEKMLYTQAELIPIYYKLYLKTNKPLYKKIVLQTASFVQKNFKNKKGLYYSASDANSLNFQKQKQEGFYFTYTNEQLKKAFKKEGIKNIQELLDYFGVEDFGNFEKKLNNIYISFPEENPKNLKKAKEILLKLRANRQKPFVDKKVLTSWNALMIKALLIASNLDKSFEKEALNSLETLYKTLYKNGVLYHQVFQNKSPIQRALLEDYSFLSDAFLQAYKNTYEDKYLHLATKLNKQIIKKFYNNKIWYLDEEKKYEVSFIDRYYVSTISKFFHTSLNLANLNYDLELLSKTKGFIKEQSNQILSNLGKHPEALRAIIKSSKKIITIKSNKNNLLKNKKLLEKIQYPYVLTKKENTSKYLACDESSCFYYNNDLNAVIKQIDNF